MNKNIKKLISTHVIALLLMLGAGVTVAHAQTYDPQIAQSTTTIGVPTTGAGGDASLNLTLLVSSALLIAGGAWYISSGRKVQS